MGRPVVIEGNATHRPTLGPRRCAYAPCRKVFRPKRGATSARYCSSRHRETAQRERSRAWNHARTRAGLENTPIPRGVHPLVRLADETEAAVRADPRPGADRRALGVVLRRYGRDVAAQVAFALTWRLERREAKAS